MFCSRCGKELPGGNSVCPYCDPEPSRDKNLPEADRLLVPKPQVIAANEDGNQERPLGQSKLSTPPKSVSYAKSCISCALSDTSSQSGLIRRIILIAIVSCVPLLNFTASGYLLDWACGIPRFAKAAAPAKIVTAKNFKIGFYAFLISLPLTLVSEAASRLVDADMYLAAGAFMALAIVAIPFVSLGQMRATLTSNLKIGFEVSKLQAAMRRNWKTLLGAIWVPTLVAGVAICAYALIVVFATSGMLIDVYASGDLGPSLSMIAVVAIAIIPSLIAGTYASVISQLALGHWVARYAPEWAHGLK